MVLQSERVFFAIDCPVDGCGVLLFYHYYLFIIEIRGQQGGVFGNEEPIGIERVTESGIVLDFTVIDDHV